MPVSNTQATAVFHLGVDIGSTTSKAVALAGGKIIGRSLRPTGEDFASAARDVIADAAVGRPGFTVGTGYGRRLVPGADRTLTEITCLALGARALDRDAAACLDICGQDAKFLWLTPDGRPAGFALNDRCAAGTGRFLELAAARIGLRLEEWETVGLDEAEGLVLSATCGVFAESELVGHLASGMSPRALAAAAALSITARVVPLAALAGRPGMPGNGGLVLAGGVSNNALVVAALREAFATLGLPVRVLPEPSYAVAYGAALAAAKLFSTGKEPE
ncbi:MAG: acyl-CoA dehydratase activase [bacterium]|nr:acyl-CoA dehydratase activase [bacterium]